MSKTQSIFKLFSAALVFSLLFSVNAFAEDGKIMLTNKVFKQVIKADEQGNTTYDYIEPDTALPGDVMMYTITFENIGDSPAEGIVINNPVPNNSEYRVGSAKGKNAEIVFSIDGGESFGNPEDLVVNDKNGKQWTAKPESYTHIRWVYKQPLAPGEKDEVSFKTKIKGNE